MIKRRRSKPIDADQLLAIQWNNQRELTDIDFTETPPAPDNSAPARLHSAKDKYLAWLQGKMRFVNILISKDMREADQQIEKLYKKLATLGSSEGDRRERIYCHWYATDLLFLYVHQQSGRQCRPVPQVLYWILLEAVDLNNRLKSVLAFTEKKPGSKARLFNIAKLNPEASLRWLARQSELDDKTVRDLSAELRRRGWRGPKKPKKKQRPPATPSDTFKTKKGITLPRRAGAG